MTASDRAAPTDAQRLQDAAIGPLSATQGERESMRTGIGSFCIRNVVTVPRDATVAEAATLMRRHHIGAVVIVEAAVGPFPQ